MDTETSWLADGVREIEKLAKAAQVVEPKLFALPGEKRGTYAIVTPGPAGSTIAVNPVLTKPDWHSETLETPDQLKGFIQNLGDRQGEGAKLDGVAYVGQDKIVVAYDFEDRRDRAYCPLKMSEPWKWLATKQPQLDQKTLVRVLRIIFDRCLPSDSNLISVLRNVKWKQDGTAEANLQRGKEALGRQIMNEITGVADFPEEFTLRVQCFENVNFSVMVRVALEILPDVQRFEVIPFPNELNDGMTETLERIRNDIEDGGIPAFIGSIGVSA